MLSRIKELCAKKGITIAELERKCGIGNGIIARWDKSKPSYDRVALVAAALGVTPAYLMGEEKTEDPEGASEESIKFALFGGDADAISDEAFDEVKRFAAFVAQREKEKKE